MIILLKNNLELENWQDYYSYCSERRVSDIGKLSLLESTYSCVMIVYQYQIGYIPQFVGKLDYLNKLWRSCKIELSDNLEIVKNQIDNFLIRSNKLLIFL